MMQEQFCQSPTDHIRHVIFCLRCAKNSLAFNRIFHCRKCNLKEYRQHQKHIDIYKLDDEKFKGLLGEFYDFLKTNFPHNTNETIQQIISVPLNSFDYHKFQDPRFLKWICSLRFWTLTNVSDRQVARNTLVEKLQRYYQSQNNDFESIQINRNSGIIDWGHSEDSQIAIDGLVDSGRQESQELDAEVNIIDLLLQAGISTNSSEKQRLINNLASMSVLKPLQINILLAQIQLMDKDDATASKWEPILNKILQLDPSIKQKPIFLYLLSLKFWKKIDFQQKLPSDQMTFVNPTNHNCYLLVNPQKYVDLISEAIIGYLPKSSLVLYSCRSLGYLSLKKYSDALKDIRKAEEINKEISLETLIINKAYCQSKIKTISDQLFDAQIIQQSLGTSASLYYLVNVLKLLKNSQRYDILEKMALKILDIDPNNLFALNQSIKAQLHQGFISSAQKQFDSLSLRLPSRQIDIKHRQFQYAYARHETTNLNHSLATQKFKEIYRKKKSPSSCFSIASSLYNEQKWQEAQSWIDEALKSKKEHKKYLKLKFYISIMKKDLLKARDLLKYFEVGEIKPELQQIIHRY